MTTPHLGIEIDTAAMITVLEQADVPCVFQSLLLLLCSKDWFWSATDMNVFVYGIIVDEFLTHPQSPIPARIWQTMTNQIAYRGWFMVADPPSDTLIALRRRYQE
jgi:hypothetical protein